MRGAECCFSSIDCHTQHSYSKIHKGVLGLVIEIGHDGQKGVHEFYEMSYYGKQIVDICSREKDCNSNEQHESCSGRDLYDSANQRVIFQDDLSLNVTNFMRITDNSANSSKVLHPNLENDTTFDQSFETVDISADPIDKVVVDDEPILQCRACKKRPKHLLIHISRSKECKEFYGEEFEIMKVQPLYLNLGL